MTTYLLDANVLIALTIEEHEHHRRVSTWLANVERVALCPLVEGALFRFLVRIGESVGAASEVLRLLYANHVARSGPTPCRTSKQISVMFAAIVR